MPPPLTGGSVPSFPPVNPPGGTCQSPWTRGPRPVTPSVGLTTGTDRFKAGAADVFPQRDVCGPGPPLRVLRRSLFSQGVRVLFSLVGAGKFLDTTVVSRFRSVREPICRLPDVIVEGRHTPRPPPQDSARIESTPVDPPLAGSCLHPHPSSTFPSR